MATQQDSIRAVPTNVITGFLGVGKTSAILHLLSQKPAHERWAVLVNEFGEIGVDGSIIGGQHSEKNEIFIREVPGGCMCCAAGLPMQIALNQLLARAKPSRLLIEPTGLGHPREVLEVLSADHYKDVLRLQKVVTLVDARKLGDTRYTEHETFNQQMAVADIVVANKVDLYGPKDKDLLAAYLAKKDFGHQKIAYTEQGRLEFAVIDGDTSANFSQHHHHHAVTPPEAILSEPDISDGEFIKAENRGEGFSSVGWRFPSSTIFAHDKLLTFFGDLDAERMKAVFITQSGIFAYNLDSDGFTVRELDECEGSRIEIIAASVDASWEQILLTCAITGET